MFFRRLRPGSLSTGDSRRYKPGAEVEGSYEKGGKKSAAAAMPVTDLNIRTKLLAELQPI